MPTLEDLLADLDDIKSALYQLVEAGELDENKNDQAQECLREAYYILEADEDVEPDPGEMQEWHDFDPDC
jgi:hypothetical protein